MYIHGTNNSNSTNGTNGGTRGPSRSANPDYRRPLSRSPTGPSSPASFARHFASSHTPTSNKPTEGQWEPPCKAANPDSSIQVCCC